MVADPDLQFEMDTILESFSGGSRQRFESWIGEYDLEKGLNNGGIVKFTLSLFYVQIINNIKNTDM